MEPADRLSFLFRPGSSGSSLSSWVRGWAAAMSRWWDIPIHRVYPVLFSSDEHMYRVTIARLVECMEEHFPQFDDAYYKLRLAGRSAGNIQESVPTPRTFRPESLLVGVIRHFRERPEELALLMDQLLFLGAQPDGITVDGPSWISPIVAVEIYISDREWKDRLHKQLILYGADPNESGWCGRTVLHYRIYQFIKSVHEHAIVDLIEWINLPQIRTDLAVFEWHPTLRCRCLSDYIDDVLLRGSSSANEDALRSTVLQILCSYGHPYRPEDRPHFPTIGEVIHGSSEYIFYQERVANHWQLGWSQLQPSEWAHLMENLAYWVLHPEDMGSFDQMWVPIEQNRKMVLGSRFGIDSLQFHPPEKFPYAWTITLQQTPERSYQVWGGYLQIFFQHPVHPETGEMIPFQERKRLWSTYLETDRMLMYWKDEMVLPDMLHLVLENIRSYLSEHPDVLLSSESMRWVFRVPIDVFLTPVLAFHDTRVKREAFAFRQLLDKIFQWIQKIHPYSNFHQLLDHKKRESVAFWKYLMQVLAYRPALSADCIPLYPFEKWIAQHTDYRTPSTVLRLGVGGMDDPLHAWTLHSLQIAFVRCVYLCARENFDGFHYRFEEEWNIIDFFLKNLERHGHLAVESQSDVFFNDLIDFLYQHTESYPYTTFSTLNKKIAALLRVFQNVAPVVTPVSLRNPLSRSGSYGRIRSEKPPSPPPPPSVDRDITDLSDRLVDEGTPEEPEYPRTSVLRRS